jgi:hypothetical protein
MILEFDVDGGIDLKYDVDGGAGYDDLAEEAITMRTYSLDILPLLKTIGSERLTLLSYLYGVKEDMFKDVGISLNQYIDGLDFKISGVILFGVNDILPDVSSDELISKLMEYIENKFTGDIDTIIDTGRLNEMVNYDRSIDFRINGVHGIGANVIETRD